jgi:hypothetical protein
MTLSAYLNSRVGPMLCLPGRGGAVAGVRHAVNRPPEVSLTDRSTGRMEAAQGQAVLGFGCRVRRAEKRFEFRAAL